MRGFGVIIFWGAFAFSNGQTSSQKLNSTIKFKTESAKNYNFVLGFSKNKSDFALLGQNDGISLVDVTETDRIKALQFIPSPFSRTKKAIKYFNYIYITSAESSELTIIDINSTPLNPIQILDFGITKSLYLDKKRKLLFATQFFNKAVKVYSILKPLEPVEIISFGMEGHQILGFENTVVVSEGWHGNISFYDTSDLKNIQLIKQLHIPDAGYVSNIALSEDNQTLVTIESTLRKTIKVWNIKDLKSIQLKTEFLFESELANDLYIKNNNLYVSHLGSGLKIFDLSAQYTEVAEFKPFNGVLTGYQGIWTVFPYPNSSKLLIVDLFEGLFVSNF